KEVDEFIAKNPAKFNQPESWFQLVIIKKEFNEIIGDVGVHFMGEDGFQCELGCTVSKKQQGKGFATEAMKITIDYLFNSLNKHRIIGSVDPENVGSIRLLERLSFRKEAHFKESLWVDGKWVDDVIYGLLKNEWNTKYGKI
ncbi:MAG: GNAT family protein, partial [Ginsengibacter sp.]